jgi:streptomycin 6-kinase
MLNIPAVVREKALAVGAVAWVDGLPQLISAIEEDWDISVGRPYCDSTEAFVAEATCGDGTPVVLKLLVPGDHDGAAREATVLRLAVGKVVHGCSPRTSRAVHSCSNGWVNRSMSSGCRWSAATRSSCPLPRGSGAPRQTAVCRPVLRRLDGSPSSSRRCGKSSTGRAASVPSSTLCGARRSAAMPTATKQPCSFTATCISGNALEATGGFKLVDPDGLLAEAEYDLGIIMRQDPLDGDLPERARRLADRTGLDANAIWEWGVVERVSTGLLGTRVGLQPIARQMLAAASRRSGRRSRPSPRGAGAWPPSHVRRGRAPRASARARERRYHVLLAMTRQSDDAFARRLLDEVGATEALRTRIEAIISEG